MFETRVEADYIECKEDPVTSLQIDAFRKATRSIHCTEIPPTFATRFRRAEFLWLDKLGVDLRNLLHTDQEYEYLSPFQVGDIPVMVTRVLDSKERKGRTHLMKFYTFGTDVKCTGETRVICRTTFVVRIPNPEAT